MINYMVGSGYEFGFGSGDWIGVITGDKLETFERLENDVFGDGCGFTNFENGAGIGFLPGSGESGYGCGEGTVTKGNRAKWN